MEPQPTALPAGPPTPRFRLGKQSSLAPDHVEGGDGGVGAAEGPVAATAAAAETNGVMSFQLMYLAHEGNAEGIRELLDGGADPNFRDSDGRTALHIAACEGHPEVVELLLQRGAETTVEDQWGSTPLADAMHYQNHDVIKILEKHGSKHKIAPMHVNNIREVPEYEIDPDDLDFTNASNISKGTYMKATWRGIPVAVKKLDDDLIMDENKVQAFRDELEMLQLIRHPNVVQFLGAVTQSNPMMIIMEFMRKGDLRTHLNKKGALAPSYAVKLALDIARGMSYLHEHKPQAIIHRDLEPSSATGAPLASIEGSVLTLLRTTAVSALAASPTFLPATLAGAGALATYLAEAHLAALPSISHVLIWNRTRAKSAALVTRLREAHPGLAVEEVGGMDEAVTAADVVSYATGLREPVMRGELLRPGVHLDLVGSFTPAMRECDNEALRYGRVFIDFEAAMEEARELVGAVQRGVLRREDVAETLAELATGTVDGQRSDDEITVFKSSALPRSISWRRSWHTRLTSLKPRILELELVPR